MNGPTFHKRKRNKSKCINLFVTVVCIFNSSLKAINEANERLKSGKNEMTTQDRNNLFLMYLSQF